MSRDKGSNPGMKTAYEAALEWLERQGIEVPRDEALAEEVREKVAEVHRRADAGLAELEILHRDRLRKLPDPVAREAAEREYRADRRRIEERREREVRKLRDGA